MPHDYSYHNRLLGSWTGTTRVVLGDRRDISTSGRMQTVSGLRTIEVKLDGYRAPGGPSCFTEMVTIPGLLSGASSKWLGRGRYRSSRAD